MLLVLLWVLRRQKNITTRKRRYKTRPVFRHRRDGLGEMTLINQVYSNDSEMFYKCFRMSTTQFDYLLSRLAPAIARGRQRWIDSIGARQRLAMTLR